MSLRFRSVYWKLCFLSIAQLEPMESAAEVLPSDCLPGHMDSSCAKAVIGRPDTPPAGPPPPATSFPLAGMPASGYAYWGYDFASRDTDQFADPRFVNRSGRPLIVTLTFSIPDSPCGRGCLPDVEYYFDQDVHKRDPRLQVSGSTAKAVVPLKPGDRYAFIVGLWKAYDPVVAVTLLDGTPVSPDLAGMSARPDLSDLVHGMATKCTCEDGTEADCYNGDHYSNGLSGRWSQTMGLSRFNEWTLCQRGGT